MMKRYKTKVASLEPPEVTWSKEYTRYQDDVELLRRAAKTLRETYRVEARRDDEDRKYRKTLQLKFADPETGLGMFDGNLLAAGREEDGFDSLEDAEQEIARLKKLKVKENDEDAVELLTLVLNEMEEDERDKSVWLSSPYVDREVKKKRPSMQSVCAAVAAKNDPHFPERTLEVEYPKRHRNKEMGNTDSIKEKFEIAEALASQLEKALKEIKEVKRPLQEADVAPVPDCEVDGLLKEKKNPVSGFAAQLKETPAPCCAVSLTRERPSPPPSRPSSKPQRGSVVPSLP